MSTVYYAPVDLLIHHFYFRVLLFVVLLVNSEFDPKALSKHTETAVY
jgi:hypothetical protein